MRPTFSPQLQNACQRSLPLLSHSGSTIPPFPRALMTLTIFFQWPNVSPALRLFSSDSLCPSAHKMTGFRLASRSPLTCHFLNCTIPSKQGSHLPLCHVPQPGSIAVLCHRVTQSCKCICWLGEHVLLTHIIQTLTTLPATQSVFVNYVVKEMNFSEKRVPKLCEVRNSVSFTLFLLPHMGRGKFSETVYQAC